MNKYSLVVYYYLIKKMRVDDNGGGRHWRFTCDGFVDENHNDGVVEVVVFVDIDVVF